MCVIVYCDVVNVQPRLNFSDEIIILNFEFSVSGGGDAGGPDNSWPQ